MTTPPHRGKQLESLCQPSRPGSPGGLGYPRHTASCHRPRIQAMTPRCSQSGQICQIIERESPFEAKIGGLVLLPTKINWENVARRLPSNAREDAEATSMTNNLANLSTNRRSTFLLTPYEAERTVDSRARLRRMPVLPPAISRKTPYLPSTMESEIRPRSRSTRSTQTRTVSPTATTSLGCLTKRFESFEMCTSPSW